MPLSPAAKAKEDAVHLRERLGWAYVAAQSSVISAEEEKHWLEEIERIVSYYLGEDHPEFLKLNRVPANPRLVGGLRLADFGDDEFSEQQRVAVEPNRRILARLRPLETCIQLIEEQIRDLPETPMDTGERRKQREQVLFALYHLVDGRLGIAVPFEAIVDKAKLPSTLVREFLRDLAQQGRIADHSNHQYALTVQGQSSAENLLDPQTEPEPDQASVETSRKVFVVHGHDGEAKHETARFLEKLALEAVILHEQPNQGRTIIEKLEKHVPEARFAIVLLTPDDFGYRADHPDLGKPRARQNVVLEHGIFLGKLGRSSVVALVKGDVEVPSDLHGVIYVAMDARGAWKLEVAKEIKAAGIDVDLNLAVT
jgi:predicted nucleotide-binding protein